jgi:hypothetical protein
LSLIESDAMKYQAITIFAFLCLLGRLPLAIHQAEAAEAKPNVLFIAVDDLNDYISPLDNHPGIKTPNFDRYATGFEELYDLKTDRNEFVNLASKPEFAQVKERMIKALPSKVTPIQTVPKDSPYNRSRKKKK